MSEAPLHRPRPLPDTDLDAVTGGYGWLSNPLQQARDRMARDPDYTPPADSIRDQLQDLHQQQSDALLREVRGDQPDVAAMMDALR